MIFSEKLNIIKKVLQAIVFRKKNLLAVTWNITFKCNLQCGYCGAWEKEMKELNTERVFAIVEEFANLGTKFIKFSGGEPLLREDLGEIIDFCKRKGIRVLLNSNGTLVKKEFWKIKEIDEIQLSLDGPRDINDALRGKGVHDKVIEAIEICTNNKINVSLSTVISKYNIACIPYILDVATKYKIVAWFQPVNQMVSTYSDKDIHSLFAPEERDFKSIVNFLIEEKKKGNKAIGSSYAGLKHLYHWPTPKKVDCFLRFFHCLMEPDGRIFTCNEFKDYQKYLIPVSKSIRDSFNKISFPHPCVNCWCSDIELNLICNFKLNAMMNIWKRFS